MPEEKPPLVAHIVYRFDVGGLENGIVNLLNHMPPDRYRHVIIALTEFTDFRKRLTRADVEVLALHKKPGNDLFFHRRLWRELRRRRPSILHTRNLPTLECVVTGRFAGVRARVHGEHGRDVYDLHGKNRRYNALRRAIRRLVTHYITVSDDLAKWLAADIQVPEDRISQIYNGVDSERFHPRSGPRPRVLPEGFATDDTIVFGTVGRMQAVKHQTLLARAFVALCKGAPDLGARARLILVGDGPLRSECEKIVRDAGLAARVWLPGERNDVAECLRALDVFVLPSLGEGISNTILEAMSSGLPLVATAVGGNPELVLDGVSGQLVPSDEVDPMTAAMARYLQEPGLVAAHGMSGRRVVEQRFSMDAMVNAYLRVYDSVLQTPKGQ